MGDLGSTATERDGLSLGQRLRRWWRYHPFAVVAAAVFAFGSGAAVVGTTLASFTAVTGNNASTFAGGWIEAASSGSVTPSGYDGQLAWLPGRHGVTGENVYGLDNSSSSTCPANGYSQLGSSLTATTSTYTDSHATNAANGHYYCYYVVSTGAGNWTTQSSTFPATQLGLVAQSVAVSNGGTSGSIDAGDKIVITFNQAPTSFGSSPQNVCVDPGGATGKIIVGDTATGGSLCSNSDTGASVDIGVISGLTISTTNRDFTGSTVALSGNVLTITLATGTADTVTVSTGTFTPASTLKSAATTDQATVCTSATFHCTPTTTGSY